MKTCLLLISFSLLSCLSNNSAGAQRVSTPRTIQGVVTDSAGSPIVSARVVVKRGVHVIAEGLTDTAGQFKLVVEDSQAISLLVVSDGFAPYEEKLSESQASLRISLTPASVSAQVIVAATLVETRLSETAASVVTLNANDLKTTAAATLDDALRQVPGFSLFRRSGSRTANPTSQGVSLRGVGASGASRAIVLADGLPLNDPFGGWVYWDRVPRESINSVEVLQGAASHLYGSGALGGLISISTRSPTQHLVSLTTSYGNETTPDVSLYASTSKNDWAASVAAEFFRTDGYVLVREDERGLVDAPAGSRNSVINLLLQKSFGEKKRLFGRASFFGEARNNGTPLQTNRTHLRQFAVGGDWSNDQVGSFVARAYGGTQLFDQNFSAIAIDRGSETLTRLQRVPAQAMGLSLNWSRGFGASQTFVAGFETREVRGASDEIAFVNGRATSFVGAGGRERSVGVYLEDLMRIGSRVFLNVGGRVDRWRNFAALSATRPIFAPNPTNVIVFPDREEHSFSPQAAVVYKINERVSLLASAARAFRAPTLNELYRSFRVGNVLTLANEQLRAEDMTSGEAGVRITTQNGKVGLRGSFFWSEITRPVANVTLQTTPALITRQRQNLGRTRSRGVDFQTEARFHKYWEMSAGYLFADATVVSFPANTNLEGLQIPQVPRHQFTFQARYSNPAVLTIGLQARASTSQFDDDQNLFILNHYSTFDVFVSRRLNRRLEGFVAVENLFNQRYEVGSTPVTTVGPPVLARVGLRLQIGSR